MLERALQKACLDWVKREHAPELLAVNIHGGGYSNKGFPDILVFGNGTAAAIELKADSGYKVQPDQKVWRGRFARSGTHYAVCTSLDEFKQTVERVFG